MGGVRGRSVCRLPRGHVVHKVVNVSLVFFFWFFSLFLLLLLFLFIRCSVRGLFALFGILGVLMDCGDQGGWEFLPLKLYMSVMHSLFCSISRYLFSWSLYIYFYFIANLWLQKHFI